MRIFPAIVLAIHGYALAGDNAAGLLCARLAEPARGEFQDFINENGVQIADGEIKLQGEFRHGDLCIRNVTFAGAFGVLMATGESCSSDEAVFVQSIGVAAGAQEASSVLPELLARFELPNGKREPGGLIVYRGEPSFRPRPAASSSVSYMCIRQDGGPQ